MFETETQQLETVGQETPSSRRTRLCLTVLTAFTALFAGILFGYDLGIVSTALLQLTDKLHMTCVMEELVVSGLLIGALVGSVFGGILLDFFGRRFILLINCLFFIIGALILSTTNSYYLVILGRVVTGVSVSIAAMGECLYTSEVASPRHRGKMVSLNEMGITLGILIAYFNGYLLIQKEEGWRFMFGLSVVPSVLQFFCLLMLPPSPRFLLIKGKEDEATAVLARMRICDVQTEISEIRTLLQNERNRTFLDLCSRTGNFHYRFAIGAALSIFQQLTGQSNMIYYAPVLLQGLGMKSQRISTLTTVGLGAVKVVSTAIAISIVDKVGRRTLLMVGSGLMALGLMIIAVSSTELSSVAHREIFCVDKWIDNVQNSTLHEVPSASNITYHDTYLNTKTASIISVFAMMLYVAAYAMSFGPVTWLILSEIFPPTLRGRAIAGTTALNWTFNLILSVSFLNVLEKFGAPVTFALYCVVCALVVVFVFVFVPETNGKSLEKISRDFDSGVSLPKFLRNSESQLICDPDPVVTYSHLSDI